MAARLALLGCALAARPVGAQAPAAAVAPPATPTGALAGVVWDSTARAPLAGAAVLLAPADRRDSAVVTARADSLGRWAAGGLAAGPWVATFLHRAVQEYGVSPVPVETHVAAGDTTRVELGLPGAGPLRAALCGPPAADGAKGVLVGSVRDEEAGAWVAGARVVVSWRVLELVPAPRLRTVRTPVTTAQDGTFRLCGVPDDGSMSVTAGALVGRDSVVSGELTVAAHEEGVARVQLGVGRLVLVRDSSAVGTSTRVVGTARLDGIVLEPGGRPRAGATVRVLGAGREAVTTSAGTFRLDSLPSGSWTVDAFAIGLTPVRETVRLSPAVPSRVTLRFTSTVVALDRLTITATPGAAQALMDDFFERRERGLGRFITPDDIDRAQPALISSLFYQVPGAHVHQSSNGMARIRGRGGCMPEVFVDGVRIEDGADALDIVAPAAQVLAIEAHNDPGGLPGHIYSRRLCLTVVVWTKRDLRKYPTPERRR